MLVQPIDLLNEIKKARRDSRVLFTTYKYNQHFFENHIFSHFKNRTFPLVLVDYTEYARTLQQASKSKLAETKYFIEPIRLKGIFHPKIVLACSENSLFLIVGSANITPQGYLRNAEIEISLKIRYDRKSSDNLLLRDIKNFLMKFKTIVGSGPHRLEIDKIINKIKEIEVNKERKCWFLHNLNESILSQVKKILGSEKVKEAIVISKYFSQELSFYSRFVHYFTDRITFVIQKGNNDLPVSKLEKWQKTRNFKFRSLHFSQGERNLHAKVIILKTESHSYCLSGSANFTESGLYSSAKNRNLEVCLLRKEKNINYFDYLLKSDHFSLNTVNLNSVESIDFPSEKTIKTPDFCIIEARLIGSSLKISIDKIVKEKCKAIVRLVQLDKEYQVDIDSGEIVLDLNESDLEELNKSCVITMELVSEGMRLKSDSKLIHNPQYFPSQYRVLNALVNMEEAQWLFSLLDKFANMPLIRFVLPIIEKIEEDGILDEIDPTKKEDLIIRFQRKISRIKPYSFQKKLSDLIRLFLHRHERSVKKAIKHSDIRNAMNVLTSFIIINKLIVWSVSKGMEKINYLSNLLSNIREFCDMRDKKPGERNYPNLLKHHKEEQVLVDSKILYHLISLAYFVDFLQLNSTEFQRGFHKRLKRHFVKEAFERIFVNVIRLLQETTSEKLLDEEKLKQTTREYIRFVPSKNHNIKDITTRLNTIFKKFDFQLIFKGISYEEVIL